ncbi:MAG: 6-bladed beta-propeller [Gemmatimonadaceae bacterium]
MTILSNRRARWLPLPAIVLSVCACASEKTAPAGAIAVDTVGGVVRVRNPASSPAWSARELVTIGTMDSGPASFGQVRSVVADDDGTIYVADIQADEIRVFDRQGRFLRTIGRRGAGPAEFGDLYSLAWLGDTLVALDPRNARIGLLTRSGAWLGELRHQPISGDLSIRLYHAGEDAIYAYGVAPAAGGKLESHYVQFGGGRTDTIPHPPRVEGEVRGARCDHAASGTLAFFTNPFAPYRFHVPAPGGSLAIAHSATYRIAFLDASGDTLRVVEKAHDNVPINDEEWDEATAKYREWRANLPGARCEPDGLKRPDAKPALIDIFFDSDQRMWVEVTTAAGRAFDVFDVMGRQLGRVPISDEKRNAPPYARGNRLYLVAADSLDVQTVRVYELEMK